MHNILILLIIFVGLYHKIRAQKTWTIDQCITRAQDVNLDIREASFQMKSAEVESQKARNNVLPQINGFANHTFNFGQTLDPFTNQFVLNGIQSNRFGLSGNLVVFDGLNNLHQIRAKNNEVKSNSFWMEEEKRRVAIVVTDKYYKVLMIGEQINSRKQALEIANKNLDLSNNFHEIGTKTELDISEMEAQCAREEMAIEELKLEEEMLRMDLKNALMLDQSDTFLFSIAPMDMLHNNPLTIDLENNPAILSADYSVRAAQQEVGSNGANFLPQISISGFVGTGFSEARKDVVGVNYSGLDTLGFTSNNQAVLTESYEYEMKTRPFNDQLRDNINYSLAINLSLPILNNGLNKLRSQQAKVAYELAKVQQERIKREIEYTLTTNDKKLELASRQYDLSVKQLKLEEKTYENAENLYKMGRMDVFELNTIRNRTIEKEIILIKRKYDWLILNKTLTILNQ